MGWDALARYLPLLLEGARTTLLLFILTLFFGFVIAMPVALARNAAGRALSLPAHAFILFFRGAPLLSVLFLAYYGLPQIPGVKDSALWFLIRDPLPVAVFALSLNSAGFQAEIIAGALRNVPRGEVEAARSAGFGRLGIFRHIVAPHAVRIGIRSFGNELVFVLKGTAVASFITLRDMMGAANQIYLRTFDPVTPLLLAGLFYFAFVFVIMRLVARVEILVTPRLRVDRTLARLASVTAGRARESV